MSSFGQTYLSFKTGNFSADTSLLLNLWPLDFSFLISTIFSSTCISYLPSSFKILFDSGHPTQCWICNSTWVQHFLMWYSDRHGLLYEWATPPSSGYGTIIREELGTAHHTRSTNACDVFLHRWKGWSLCRATTQYCFAGRKPLSDQLFSSNNTSLLLWC